MINISLFVTICYIGSIYLDALRCFVYNAHLLLIEIYLLYIPTKLNLGRHDMLITSKLHMCLKKKSSPDISISLRKTACERDKVIVDWKIQHSGSHLRRGSGWSSLAFCRNLYHSMSMYRIRNDFKKVLFDGKSYCIVLKLF